MNTQLLTSDAAAGAMLFKELQAFMNTSNNSPSVSTNITLPNPNPTALFTPSLSQPSNTPSLVGLPLFNPLNTEQLQAVHALLPSNQLFSSPLTAAPGAGFSSFNLGSATLLNLKDKTTGLETVGIMPTTATKQLNQSININQVALPNSSSAPSSNSLSLHTLSNLFHGANVLNKVSNTTTTAAATASTAPIEPMITTPSVGERSLTDTNHLASFSAAAVKSDPNNNESSHTIAELAPTTGVAAAVAPKESNAAIDQIPYSSSSQFMFGRRLAHTRKFVCNQCRVMFASLAELNKHTLEAHNSFKCTICSAHFTQRSNLQRHSLKHVGFKPFTCNVCGKEYYRKDHLVRHIEVTHPNCDPKMNITVHLTSSECLDYLDRVNMGKQTPSPGGDVDDSQRCANDATTVNIMEIIENAKMEEPSTTAELNETSIDDTALVISTSE